MKQSQIQKGRQRRGGPPRGVDWGRPFQPAPPAPKGDDAGKRPRRDPSDTSSIDRLLAEYEGN